jgi:hypothetical protein
MCQEAILFPVIISRKINSHGNHHEKFRESSTSVRDSPFWWLPPEKAKRPQARNWDHQSAPKNTKELCELAFL